MKRDQAVGVKRIRSRFMSLRWSWETCFGTLRSTNISRLWHFGDLRNRGAVERE